jgi:hypothetical protein
MTTTQLPYCIQVIQALGPSFVAIVAAGIGGLIAYRQWRTVQAKLKLDLFNERYKVFEVIDQINRAALEAKGENWTGEYLSKMKEAMSRMHRLRLLFPTQIGSQVDKIVEHWHDFTTLKAEGEGITKPSQEWSDNIKNRRRLWDEIEAKNKELRGSIEEFVRVDWNG